MISTEKFFGLRSIHPYPAAESSVSSISLPQSGGAIQRRCRCASTARSDNGSEFIAHTLADWAKKHEVHLDFIEPGKPAQNGRGPFGRERFNRTFRDEILDAYLFENLAQVREMAEAWMLEYNYDRPHDSLGGLTPILYALEHMGGSLDDGA